MELKKEINRPKTVNKEPKINTNTNDFFFDARILKKNDVDLFQSLFYEGINNLLIKSDQVNYSFYPTNIKKFVEVNKLNELNDLDKNLHIVSSDRDILLKAGNLGYNTCYYTNIVNKEDFENIQKVVGDNSYKYIFVELKDPTNIPLELIIAKNQKSTSKIIKKVNTVEDGEIALAVMEVGVDNFMLSTNDIHEIKNYGKFIKNKNKGNIELKTAYVKNIKHIGIGHRSCVDTTAIMDKSEGMLVGSTSGGGILVCSETHYLPYMNLRPFRVNAGAVHSYIWGPDKAEYLTDLKCGKNVLCVDSKGSIRPITVGRVKTEVRPLLLIEALIDDNEINVILQDDWHVRVMGADGKAKNITSLKPGDKLLGCLFKSGRHVGIQIDEHIIEQ